MAQLLMSNHRFNKSWCWCHQAHLPESNGIPSWRWRLWCLTCLITWCTSGGLCKPTFWASFLGRPGIRPGISQDHVLSGSCVINKPFPPNLRRLSRAQDQHWRSGSCGWTFRIPYRVLTFHWFSQWNTALPRRAIKSEGKYHLCVSRYLPTNAKVLFVAQKPPVKIWVHCAPKVICGGPDDPQTYCSALTKSLSRQNQCFSIILRWQDHWKWLALSAAQGGTSGWCPLEEQICSLREGIERYVPLYTRFKSCPDALLLWVTDSGPTSNWPVPFIDRFCCDLIWCYELTTHFDRAFTGSKYESSASVKCKNIL